MRAIKDRRTRATKVRSYGTKFGERVYHVGQALAVFASGPRWVSGNGEEATMNACLNAYRKECAERETATRGQNQLEAERRAALPPAPRTLRELQADYLHFCERRRRSAPA